MYKVNYTKANFIHEFLSGDVSGEIADINLDDFNEKAVAIVSGDPRLEQLAQMQREAAELSQEFIAYQHKQRATASGIHDLKREVSDLKLSLANEEGRRRGRSPTPRGRSSRSSFATRRT